MSGVTGVATSTATAALADEIGIPRVELGAAPIDFAIDGADEIAPDLSLIKGAGGAFIMGVEHGAFCVGCCWVLMGLLFFGGVMNLLCVAAIAIFVLIEKIAPLGAMTGRVTGIFLVLAGVYVTVQG